MVKTMNKLQKELRTFANLWDVSQLVEYLKTEEEAASVINEEAAHLFAPFELVAMLIQWNIAENNHERKGEELPTHAATSFRNYLKGDKVGKQLAEEVNAFGFEEAHKLIAVELGGRVWTDSAAAMYMSPESVQDVGTLASVSEFYRHGQHFNNIARRLLY